MKLKIASICVALAIPQLAAAQDGLYYGIGLAAVNTSSDAPIVPFYEASTTDFGLALTLGYRFASTGPLTYGIEGNVDVMSGKRMTGDPVDACEDISPVWCEVDTVARLRATLSSDVGTGTRLTGSIGAVMADGLAEDGPGNYVDTAGHGLSLGVAWEKVDGPYPVRIDLNMDHISKDNANLYDRQLDMIGLRVSYMF